MLSYTILEESNKCRKFKSTYALFHSSFDIRFKNKFYYWNYSNRNLTPESPKKPF
ncbi:hypothetical protein PGB90_008543 [Kerria lacca]